MGALPKKQKYQSWAYMETTKYYRKRRTFELTLKATFKTHSLRLSLHTDARQQALRKTLNNKPQGIKKAENFFCYRKHCKNTDKPLRFDAIGSMTNKLSTTNIPVPKELLSQNRLDYSLPMHEYDLPYAHRLIRAETATIDTMPTAT